MPIFSFIKGVEVSIDQIIQSKFHQMAITAIYQICDEVKLASELPKHHPALLVFSAPVPLFRSKPISQIEQTGHFEHKGFSIGIALKRPADLEEDNVTKDGLSVITATAIQKRYVEHRGKIYHETTQAYNLKIEFNAMKLKELIKENTANDTARQIANEYTSKVESTFAICHPVKTHLPGKIAALRPKGG